MSDAINTFRDLIAWRKAKELAVNVYRITSGFPTDERYGLTSQIRRASVSVSANIAEGYARGTTSEFLRFLRIARGSIAEVDTLVEIATELRLIAPDDGVIDQIAEADRVLQGLIASLERRQRANSLARVRA
ncbi:MAG: four helix bundle protein [Planctomycetes bacterium]|nr:four helix bundle protein [Planctomycetota bacterium]